MPQQQFASTNTHPNQLKDVSKYDKLGQIEIKDVFYTIEVDGLIQIKVLTSHPTWSQLLNEKVTIKQDDCVIIVVDAEELVIGDKYDLYVLKDKEDEALVQADNDYILPGQDPKDTHVLRWKLLSRCASEPKDPHRSIISIAHLPVNCPICGVPVDIDDSTGQLICINPDCRVHKYLAMNRFLTVACRLPQYQRFGRILIDHGVLNNPADLFKVTSKKKLLRNYGRADYINGFIRDVDSVRGTIMLSDWLNSIPTMKHNYFMVDKSLNQQERFKIPNYLCTTTINQDFGDNPTSLIDWVEEQFSNFALYESANEYSDWREVATSEITKYMSLPVFFDFARLFTLIDSDADISKLLKKLSKLGVFKTKEE